MDSELNQSDIDYLGATTEPNYRAIAAALAGQLEKMTKLSREVCMCSGVDLLPEVTALSEGCAESSIVLVKARTGQITGESK